MKSAHMLLAVAVIALQGCATVLEGTDQNVTIYTNTATAICDVYQKGHLVGSAHGTEAYLPIGKSREPLTVNCAAPGYAPKSVHVPSVTSGLGVVSFWYFDFAITDWIAGGLNHYPNGGIAVALYPIEGQETLRRAALAEIMAQPRALKGYISADTVRPGRTISYPMY